MQPPEGLKQKLSTSGDCMDDDASNILTLVSRYELAYLLYRDTSFHICSQRTGMKDPLWGTFRGF